MPVWHRETSEWRRRGDLVVVGITQEQHPDRCRLFAQWHGIDWPILWDPFNLTGSIAVPFAVAVDEHGVVREHVSRLEGFDERFLDVAFEAPPAEAARPDLFPLDPDAEGEEADRLRALASLLNGAEGRMDGAIAELERYAAAHPEDGAAWFHAGVARRLRYDSPHSRPDDFQAALDHWVAARALDPNQYIWRRRIQQYGPRLDKPYPFYTWVDEARAAIRGLGGEPVELVAGLTGSELASRGAFVPVSSGSSGAPPPEPPDPNGRIRRDIEDLVGIETAVAFDTTGQSRTATVHVVLRPDAKRDVHWTNDVEPLAVWFGDPDLPAGWEASARLVEHPQPAAETSTEVRNVDLEVRFPKGAEAVTIGGYALYYVCEGATGECVYRRRDFAVEVDPSTGR